MAFHRSSRGLARNSWRATNEAASYSSPALGMIDGKQYAIFVARLSALAIDPADGKVRFKIPFGQSGPTVNAATPLLCDGRLFLTASYGIGAQLLDLTASPPKPIWESDDAMSSQYNTPIFRDGYLYGIHGREDGAPADLQRRDVLGEEPRVRHDVRGGPAHPAQSSCWGRGQAAPSVAACGCGGAGVGCGRNVRADVTPPEGNAGRRTKQRRNSGVAAAMPPRRRRSKLERPGRRRVCSTHSRRRRLLARPGEVKWTACAPPMRVRATPSCCRAPARPRGRCNKR